MESESKVRARDELARLLTTALVDNGDVGPSRYDIGAVAVAIEQYVDARLGASVDRDAAIVAAAIAYRDSGALDCDVRFTDWDEAKQIAWRGLTDALASRPTP